MTNPTDPRRRAQLALIAATALPAASCLLFVAARAQPDGPLAAWLAPAFLMEALVVHAGALLGVIVLKWPHARRTRFLYASLIFVFAVVLVHAAVDRGEGAKVLEFLVLAFFTYGGVLWTQADHLIAVLVETALRWLIAFVLITLTFELVDAPEAILEWQDVRSRLTAGAIYFGMLAAVEATGLYMAVRRYLN